ncbi:MAG: UDP-N-acetylmuramate dehydrogenase [Xanthomonadales bacterium]|nr:UDP-N-acetylmuramate dehydrogenase [Xanthomonadales bacterium]
MKATPDASLQALNSFGLSAQARLLAVIEHEEDILALPAFDPAFDFMMGGGSNVIFVSDVPGTLYLNRITGKHIVDDNGSTVRVEIGAGENWHQLVRWSLDQGLHGLENLALIPGSVGAAPIQNIGAYGVELSSVLESVTAWDWYSASWVSLSREDCRLAYRDSLFRSAEPDRYLITSVEFKLSRQFKPQLDHAELREELCHPPDKASARDVFDAVVRLRRRKLPDPSLTGNAGSFFKNPIVDENIARELQEHHPGIPRWPSPDGRTKVSAAWMIESCGLKGVREGGAGVSEQHALAIVNHGGASGHDVSTLAVEIQKAVYERFGVRLEPEPRLVEFDV